MGTFFVYSEASTILSGVSAAAGSCEKYARLAGIKKSESDSMLRTLGL